MKKFTAVLVTVLLLIGLLTFGVSADGFAFREESRTRTDDALLVTWNHAEATDDTEIEDILIGGVSKSFTMDETKAISVDLSALPAGEYSVVYEYVVGAEQKTATAGSLVIEGEATVTLSAVINDDGTVTITAKNAAGLPVSDYDLTMTIGMMSGITGKTDSRGLYTSYLPVDPGASVVYEGVSSSKNGVVYSAVAPATIVRPAPTTVTTTTVATTTEPTEETTTTTEETTTTVETTTTTEVTTTTKKTTTTTKKDEEADAPTAAPQGNATVAGAGTTSHKDDKIALNVSTDQGILELFGCDFEEFSKKASLLLSEDDYNGLVGRASDNLLMLNMLSAEEQVSEAQIRKALAGISEFSLYTENERSWVTFDLSFLIMDREGNVIPVSAMPIDSTYVVQLPVPDSMKHCEMLAITLQDKKGLMTPMKVAVKNGSFKLEINSLESYTLIGFASENGNRAGGVSVWVVLLYVIGVLLIAGAGVILYFFVFRKPTQKKEEADEEETIDDAPVIAVEIEDDGNDIFSGRTDMPPQDGE